MATFWPSSPIPTNLQTRVRRSGLPGALFTALLDYGVPYTTTDPYELALLRTIFAPYVTERAGVAGAVNQFWNPSFEGSRVEYSGPYTGAGVSGSDAVYSSAIVSTDARLGSKCYEGVAQRKIGAGMDGNMHVPQMLPADDPTRGAIVVAGDKAYGRLSVRYVDGYMIDPQLALKYRYVTAAGAYVGETEDASTLQNGGQTIRYRNEVNNPCCAVNTTGYGASMGGGGTTSAVTRVAGGPTPFHAETTVTAAPTNNSLFMGGPQFDVAPGQLWNCRAMGALLAAGGGSMNIYINWLDANGSFVSGATPGTVITTPVVGTYNDLTVSATVPTTMGLCKAQIIVQILNVTTGQTPKLGVTQLMALRRPTGTPGIFIYFDGDSANSLWLGTQGASKSVLAPWRDLAPTAQFTVPATAERLQLVTQVHNIGPALNTPLSNFVRNPGAETNVTDHEAFVASTGGSGGSTTVTRQTGDARPSTGAACTNVAATMQTGGTAHYCAFCPATSAPTVGTVASLYMPVASGQFVQGRMSFKSMQTMPVGTSVQLFARILDSSAAVVANTQLVFNGSGVQITDPTNGTWYDLLGTLVMPASSAWVSLRAQINTPSATGAGQSYNFRFDRSQIARCDSATDYRPYGDGATGEGWQWRGTAHASFSDYPLTVRTDAAALYVNPPASDPMPPYGDGSQTGWVWQGTSNDSKSNRVV